MATYDELLTAITNDPLTRKVRWAVVMAAESVRLEAINTPNHANRLIWAKAAYSDPDTVAARMIYPVLAQNAAQPIATITGATDAIVQTAVNNAIDVFAS